MSTIKDRLHFIVKAMSPTWQVNNGYCGTRDDNEETWLEILGDSTCFFDAYCNWLWIRDFVADQERSFGWANIFQWKILCLWRYVGDEKVLFSSGVDSDQTNLTVNIYISMHISICVLKISITFFPFNCFDKLRSGNKEMIDSIIERRLN